MRERFVQQQLRPSLTGTFGIRKALSAIVLVLTAFWAVPSQAGSVSAVKEIKVVMDDSYPPYIFYNAQKVLQGVLVDQWKLWEKKTGIKVSLSAMDWAEAKKRMESGEYDVIDTMFFSAARAKRYDFSRPYARIPVPVFFHRDITGIAEVQDLAGFIVGVKDGDNVIRVLEEAGIRHIRKFPGYEAIVTAAKDGEIKVFSIDGPPAYYFMHKYQIERDFRRMEKILYTGEFHRAVRKGDTAMLALVENGFSMITQAEYARIDRKWMGTMIGFFEVAEHFAWILLLVSLVAGALVLWVFLLRRSVRQKTTALREANEYLTAVFDSMNDVVFIDDSEGRILDVNRRFEQVYGYTRDEAIKMNVGQLSADVEPYRQKEAEQWLEKAKASSPQIFMWMARNKKGIHFPIQVSINYVQIMGDARFVVTAQDLTEISRQKELLEAASYAGQVALWELDVAAGTVRWSETVDFILGYLPGEFSRKLSGWEEALHPDDRQDALRALQAHLVMEAPYDVQYRIRRKDGEYVWWRDMGASRRGSDGKAYRMFGACVDITARRQAEESLRKSEAKFRSLYSSMNEAVVLHQIIRDQSGAAVDYRILDCNEAFVRTVGIPRDKAVGQCASVVYGVTPAPYLDVYARVVDTGIPEIFETFFAPMDKYFSISVFSPAKEIFATLSTDITQRQQAESRQEMVVEILDILNGKAALPDVIHSILKVIKEKLKMDAVGIRLQQGEDAPYYAQEGLSDEFLRTENSLCAHGPDGCVQHDDNGNIVWECTCGLVLSGKKEPQSASFSTEGSFWSNDTSLPREGHDIRVNPRNRCAHFGYLSVALIPIRVEDRIVGLLQINSRQRGMFSREFVVFLEGVVSSIGVALSRRKDAEHLREMAAQWQRTFDAVKDAVFLLGIDQKIIRCNKAAEQILGFSASEIIGKFCWEIVHGTESPIEGCPVMQSKKSRQREMMELAMGERIFEIVADPILSDTGELLGSVHIMTDITLRREAIVHLQAVNRRLEDIIEFLPDATIILDQNKKIIAWNRAMEQMTGVRKEDILGKDHAFAAVPFYGHQRPYLIDLLDKTDSEIAREYSFVKRAGNLLYGEAFAPALFDRRGAFIWVIASPLYDSKGNVVGAIESIRDITERKKAVDSLSEQHQLLRTLIDNLPDSIYVKDISGRKILTNKADLDFIGVKEEADVLGKTDEDLFPRHLADQYRNDDLNVFDKGVAVINREELVEDSSGTKRWLLTSKIPLRNEKGEVSGLVGIGRDITERKMLETKLLTMAHYDTLTELPNRTLFLEKANMGIAHARRNRTQCAILFVDLDHFKSVNDTLGHSVGDELLKDTAVKLASCIRETDIMARLGGDEFIILLNDLDDGGGAQYTAERIREQLNVPRIIAGNDLFITASVGIAVYPNDGESLEELLKNADTAMYAAKESGRNMYCFFDHVMNKNAVTKMQVERGLRDALVKKEFALFYQPIVNVADGRVRGFEALLRWFKTEGGLVFPNEFIPVAEETGLIIPIGEWVLYEACRFNKQLMDAGCGELVVSVNISVAQLRRKNLVEVIKSALDQSGLRPELLEIEVTESLFIESLDAAVDILNAIRALGVQLSLDDFGTGYSSLVHLQKLPIMNLKIDRLFIKEIDKDTDENAMIPAIIDLAHKLKLGVIAEGVETAVQLEKLLGNHCDHYQGYLFSKPIPADKVIPFLREI